MVSGADSTPVVLAISGHDPSGAAGIQADIEAIALTGAVAATLVTATTAQNTCRFDAMFPQPLDQLQRAADCLMEDLRFSAIKIGLLGSAATGSLVASLCDRLSPLPVVLDPITHSGSGTDLADAGLLEVLARDLAPRATVITPNSREARDLTGKDSDDAAAQALLEAGSRFVLLTGADRDTEKVHNRLFCADGRVLNFEYPRLPQVFHGSGCTLSACLAGLLAQGQDVEFATGIALELTRAALERAVQRGHGQWHPVRIGVRRD